METPASKKQKSPEGLHKIPNTPIADSSGRRSPSPKKKTEKCGEPEKRKTETKRERTKSKEDKKKTEMQTCIPVRHRGRTSRAKSQDKKRKTRDYLKFRAKFNSSAGNILKDWMSLMYCILILRMNIIKFVVEQMPHCGNNEINFQKQILIESKNIYEIIREAQNFSQEQFLFLWKELERLIFSYTMIKNSLDKKKLVMSKIQTDVNKLKVSQNDLMKAYTTKIEYLKSEIEKKEEEIKLEKEEKNKIRTDLAEWLGDSSEN